MIVRVLGSAVLAGIAMFFWGFVWWTVLALRVDVYTALEPNAEQKVLNLLEEQLGETDVYFLPKPEEPEGDTPPPDQPFVKVYYRKKGTVPAMEETMGQGLAHMMISSLAMAAVLAFVANSLPSYFARVGFVGSFGLLTAFWQDIGGMIWFHHASGFALFEFGYDVSAWLVAGLVIAALVKPGKMERPEISKGDSKSS